ncbi:FAD-linked oxidoreductase [Halovivax asiaticus JCM 14624]|uniref:FAD-linked oxidoreductase n=1 Tax=Halovivax asiaticus JCM 14624 TaxID=1227490 RepID=M0BPM5_9EURY|nr:D-arabinono-1,4-lactone oxidase [Halovivax asiaticus]ELZ12268.1 FAD-linked oxidoreductase [Halovivax asiaticus JCM 14624]
MTERSRDANGDRVTDGAGIGHRSGPRECSEANRWRNWAGTRSCRPRHFYRPTTTDEIRHLVDRYAGERTIRVAGSGHSFSALVPTDDVLVSLDRFTGVTAVDYERRRATVRAGTTLGELAATLDVHGLAMTNLGDVDRQTVAGALATGTHGTGIDLGILSTQIVALELVTADGERRTLAVEDGDPFRAAQVSLGALGIITAVTLDLDPAYRLCERTWTAPLESVLDELESLREAHRHLEFFWFPHTGRVLVKTLDKTDEPLTNPLVPTAFGERAENVVWEAVCRLSSRFPRSSPGLARFTATTFSESETVGQSHEVFTTRRDVRFDESEYAVPARDGPAVVRALRDQVLASHPSIVFPIEFRYVAGDEIPLSPAYGRETAFVAVHAYHRKPARAYFEACESVFDAYDGRPHWGKRHSIAPDRLRARYPEWDTFEAIRRRFDPDGIFLNASLRDLFEPT